MISVILPAYNEEKHIAEVIKSISALVDEIIVVDDGSADRTAEVAKRAGAKVVSHEVNKGKGYALLTGFKEVKGDIIVMMDSDGQHDAERIAELVLPIKEKQADMAIGSRFMLGFFHTPKFRILTNWLSKVGTQVACGHGFSDVLCGFRAISRDALSLLDIKPSRYEVEVDMLLEAARRGLKIVEVPIPIKYGGGKSSISTLDGARLISRISAGAVKSILRGNMELKQVIVARKDIKMSAGKLAAQTAHASLSAFMKVSAHRKARAQQWVEEGQKKVVLAVNSLEELKGLEAACRKAGIECALIQDAGHTEVAAGTHTALGIGPAPDKEIDKITGSLALY